LYLLTEDADKTFAKALKLGATSVMPVTDMFWGDRSGTITDPEGNNWMIGTHREEPTPQEMKKKMKQQMGRMSASAAA
jgi:PhnB protein